MRRVSEEERALFVAALNGKLTDEAVRVVAKAVAKKAVEKAHEPSTSKWQVTQVQPGGRAVQDDEVLLFLEAIGLRVPVVTPPKQTASKSVADLPIKLPQKTRSGVDGNTKRKLERGEMAPTAKLDLHGLTESAAHGTLLTFLLAAHRRGDRLVLVVTGKGAKTQSDTLFERGRGVLRQMVPRWLEEAPMAAIIAEKRWAHRRHGGEGALYIYLRKNNRD